MPVYYPAPDPDPLRARMTHAHRPELELLAQLGRRPHITGTGGHCTAIQADAPPPHHTLYLLINTCEFSLVTDRADITQWTVSIYDGTRDDAHRCLTTATANTFHTAHHAAWTAYHAGDLLPPI